MTFLLTKCLTNLLCHICHRVIGINGTRLALSRVVVDDWLGLAVECFEPGVKGVWVVILALHQWLASDIINTLNLWWVKAYMVATARAGVNAATADSLYEELVINLHVDNGIDLDTTGAEHIIQSTSLVFRTWETVQSEALGALWLLDRVADDSDHNLVRD
mmetsp:Transcript_24165/g.48062  ORF Transcript_24165/g.48062 Transcript_24165/m.48062 type:complete len:161 (-) Transcript_24165:281-763(-)